MEDRDAEVAAFRNARPAHRKLILDLLKVLEDAVPLGKLLIDEAIRDVIVRGREFKK